jgi:tetratricopeptide (TPR) repeat protein
MSARERILIAVVAIGFIAMASPADAQQTCTPRPVALFESVRNSVQVVQASTRAPIPGARRLPVCAGDTIRVGDNSRAVIVMLGSNTPFTIDQNSEFIVTETPTATCPQTGPATGSFVELVRGALLFMTRVRRSVEICTPFVNAAIEGTEFVVRVQADRTVITVFEGTVRASNDRGMVLVGPGQQAVAVQNQAPQLQITVRPREAVQWALYYEPVLPVASLEQLAAVPEAARDAPFYVRRAGLLLAAGQLDEARTDLDQAQKLDPSSGDAYALRAIVAVALNDKDGALSNGRMAVERAPQSASAQLALSYALQADFQLEAARDAALRATELEPENAGALARLAETRLMLDDVGGAVRAARDAVQRSPQVARAQVVLGFTLLAQLNPSEAREVFQRAIDLESDNPLARLGMGLTRIRQGNLAEGRADLELAMALNPDDSLIRSYLGKAYFDEKREPLPAEQFEQAKQLDPQDPTPWFYDAIRKQTLNRPVDALLDLQSSEQLNDNRAVYRSTLLLDQDLAARGARLGRIYRDLGFERLALLEGWRSLDTDPGSHSAHRLLSDTYLVLPRHGVARDSELLQAQLLQPININPVQPRLADNGLSFLDDTGPAGAGYNEFTRLFAANQVRVVADGFVGNLGTFADNVILSGIANRLSFSVGQFHYETDGLRPNNDLRQNIYSAFLQFNLSGRTSVHFETRGSNARNGDRRLLFNPETFQTLAREKTGIDTVRLGFRRNLTATSTVIGSYIHGMFDSDFDSGFGVQQTLSDDSDFSEVRLLQRWIRLNLTGGAGYYTSANVSSLTFRGLPFPTSSSTTRHLNGYSYATLNVSSELAVIAGLSGDRFDSALLDRHQVNPKVGFSWSATPNATLRGASFRALRRTLVSSQTIEPTNIAGFNQFFSDIDSTDYWRHGIGLDVKLGDRWFTGTEFSMRELEVPTVSVPTNSVVDIKRIERSVSAYAYSYVRSQVSVLGEYTFEKANRDALGRNEGLLANATLHQLAGEIRLFAGNGLFGRFRATFVDEDGAFQNARALIVPGEDRFWVADASIGYRLPRQWGVINLDARNLLDEAFRFQDSAPRESRIQPRRSIILRVTLAL